MSSLTKLARVVVPVFSLTLLAGYVAYSHVTPNKPPPDLIGVNEIESKTASVSTVPSSIAKDHDTPPSPARSRSDLRIISSKVINQPIFSARKTSFVQTSEAVDVPLMPSAFVEDQNTRVHTSLGGVADARQTLSPETIEWNVENIINSMQAPAPKADWADMFYPIEVSRTLGYVPSLPTRGWWAHYTRCLNEELRNVTQAVNGDYFPSKSPLLLPDEAEPMTTTEVRVVTADFKAPDFRMVKDLEMVPRADENAAMPFGSFLSPTPDPLQQPGNIESILKGDGDAAARNGRMQTPEKLSTDYYQKAWELRRLMMPSSKSGAVHVEVPPWWLRKLPLP